MLLVMLTLIFSTVAADAASLERSFQLPERVAASGKELVLIAVNAVTPDCVNAGLPTVRLLGGPGHGQFAVRPAKVFPAYPPKNPRSACNSRRVPGEQITYLSSPGYSGADAVEFEVIYPNGQGDHIHAMIKVM